MNPVKDDENTTTNTPISTAQSTPGSLIAANKRLDSFIDSEIKIKTVDNEEITGTLFTIDPITSCLALNILFGRFAVVCLLPNITILVPLHHFILD